MNSEQRDATVARVQSVFATARTFRQLPVWEGGDPELTVEVEGDEPFTEQAYLRALYEVSAAGVAVARLGRSIVGTRE